MKNKKMILMGVICALSLGLAVTTHANKNADLRTAAECGDLNGVKTALNRGAYVNDADMDDDTALILAIRNNRMNVVKYLVQEVEGAKCCGSGPMNEAYEQHNIKMMQYLLDNGMSEISDPNEKITTSIYFKKFNTAKFLFDHYKINKVSFYNYVWQQCQYKNYNEADICKLIDLNIIQQTDELYTYAFNKGYTRVCDKLKSIKGDEIKLDLSNKATLKKYISDALNNCDKEKLTAVINGGYVDNVNDLFGYLNLYEIDDNEDFRIIEFLINEMDANIDSLYKDFSIANGKITLLFDAIDNTCPNLVNYLLDHGANIYIKGITAYDCQGKCYDTALNYAKKRSKDISRCVNERYKTNIKEIVKMLEEAEKKNPNPNAKPKKKSFFGKLFSKKSDKKTSTTPVSQKSAAPTVETDSPSATQTSTEPIKKPSITQKSLPVTPNAPTAPQDSNINANNDEATYQLFDGIDYDQFLCVKKAIDNKANVNAQNRDGKTPLMLAVEKEQIEIIKFLIQKGADVNASFAQEIRPGYRKKTTVFMLAKNPEIRQILSREGAVG